MSSVFPANDPTHFAQAMNVTDIPSLMKTEGCNLLLESHIRQVTLCIGCLSQLDPENVEKFRFIKVSVPIVFGSEKKQVFDDGRLFPEALEGLRERK